MLLVEKTLTPQTKGTNLSSYYNAIKKVINDYDLHILIVLDEVDKLLNKSEDNLLYNLLDTGRISLIMITNNVTCFDKIENRVKSRLGGMMPRILFPPYNAIQIEAEPKILSAMTSFCSSSVPSSTLMAPRHRENRARVGWNAGTEKLKIRKSLQLRWHRRNSPQP